MGARDHVNSGSGKGAEGLNRKEIESHIEASRENLKSLRNQISQLKEQRAKSVLKLDRGELGDIRTKIRDLELQSEDVELHKSALEDELGNLEKREPEAAEIRRKLAEEHWPLALKEYEKVVKFYGALKPSVQKLFELNNFMRELCSQHERLIGDGIRVPQIHLNPTLYSVCEAEFLAFGHNPFPLVLEQPSKVLDLMLASERQSIHGNSSPAPVPAVHVTPDKVGLDESHNGGKIKK